MTRSFSNAQEPNIAMSEWRRNGKQISCIGAQLLKLIGLFLIHDSLKHFLKKAIKKTWHDGYDFFFFVARYKVCNLCCYVGQTQKKYEASKIWTGKLKFEKIFPKKI